MTMSIFPEIDNAKYLVMEGLLFVLGKLNNSKGSSSQNGR
jgi:hypothetical protein